MGKRMKPKPRSRRRGDAERVKAKTYRRLKDRFNSWPTQPPEEPDPRDVGRRAATPAACSCYSCRWPDYNRQAAKRAANREMHTFE